MIPDRITATLILAAIIGAGVLITVTVLGIRWLARGGKPLDGLGPIGQPAPFEDEIGAEQAERLIPAADPEPCRWCTDIHFIDSELCGCETPCGVWYCKAPATVTA